MIEPFRGFRDLICTIPGIATLTADVIVAETGADMSRFPTAGHLASWAGTTPGNNESAGKVKSTQTRPGNPYLQGALGAAAMSCAQHPGTYLGAHYRRIAARRGPRKRTSRSNTPCSSRSGTWAPPAPSTTTPAPTTSPASTPNGPRTAPSTNSKHGLPRHPQPRQLSPHRKSSHQGASGECSAVRVSGWTCTHFRWLRMPSTRKPARSRGHGCARITARSWAGCISCGARCGWPMRRVRPDSGWPGRSTTAGMECVVAAPSKLQRPAGDRVKTDARDAAHLARLLRLGEITAVTVPDRGDRGGA